VIRNWIVVGVATLFLAACGSNQKKSSDGASEKTSGQNGSDVTGKAMTFNPTGSDSGAIGGLQTINFEYDKARLTTKARRILAENAEWIKNHSDANMQIEGHCDEHGSIEYNLSLGERRAKSVKRYLVSLGVQSSRLSIISYGEEKLVDTGDSDSAHARNRRANFVPIPK